MNTTPDTIKAAKLVATPINCRCGECGIPVKAKRCILSLGYHHHVGCYNRAMRAGSRRDLVVPYAAPTSPRPACREIEGAT